jgi:hypothetical protein
MSRDDKGTHELWMALESFGRDAVERVVEDANDLHAPLTADDARAMARLSTIPYWTDGAMLWSIDYQLPGARPITALQALADFGLEAMAEARDKGTWEP